MMQTCRKPLPLSSYPCQLNLTLVVVAAVVVVQVVVITIATALQLMVIFVNSVWVFTIVLGLSRV